MDLSAKPKQPPFLNKKTDVSVAMPISLTYMNLSYIRYHRIIYNHLYISFTKNLLRKEDEDAVGLPPNQSATLGVAQKLHLVSHRFHFRIEAEQVSVS